MIERPLISLTLAGADTDADADAAAAAGVADTPAVASGAVSVTGGANAAAAVRKLSANCASSMSDTCTISRPPNCANLPLTITAATPTSTEVPGVSPASTVAVRSIEADDPPRSAPLPSSCSFIAVSSSASTSMSPANAAFAGPTFTFTLPL